MSIHQRHVNIVNVPKPIVFLYPNKNPTSCHLARYKTHIFCLTQPVTWWGAAKNWTKKIGMNMHIFIKRLLFNSLCGNLKYKYILINSSTCITYPLPGLVLKRILHNNDTFVLEKRTKIKKRNDPFDINHTLAFVKQHFSPF